MATAGTCGTRSGGLLTRPRRRPAHRLERFDEGCAAAGRTERVPRSILLDFDEALRPGGRAQLADLVGRLYGLGFDECIAVSWMDRVDGGLGRSVEDLLTFVGEDLPALVGR